MLLVKNRLSLHVFAAILEGKVILLRSHNGWIFPHGKNTSHSHDIFLERLLTPFFENTHVPAHTLITPPIEDFSFGEDVYTCIFTISPFAGKLREDAVDKVTLLPIQEIVTHMLHPDMRTLVVPLQSFKSHPS